MAISPNKNERLAVAIRRMYEESETIILEKIANRVARGIEEDGWAEKKYQEIQRQRATVEYIVASLRHRGPTEVEKIVIQSFLDGVEAADADLEELGIEVESRVQIEDTNITLVQLHEIVGTFGTINTRAVEALVGKTERLLENTHMQILRNADDVYRSVIAESVGTAVTGVETRRQAAQRALNKFADRGIGAFKDDSGRMWDIASYTEMATRAALGQAAMEGHFSRLQERGYDLVQVSDHPEECEICRPWEGRILSMSGEDKRYPSVEAARSAGLWHPNCGHTAGAYIPGLSRPIHAEGDPKGYEKRQQQRYNERMIRRWKRREAVAINEDDKRKAAAKVREWQKRNREFVDKHNRWRKYERESITRAR